MDDVEGYRELRLAVVCYGGVSLSIYMHGLTKELHRLVIASAELEGDDDASMEMSGTAPCYRALLAEIAEIDSTRTRVVIDVISGTSAGGMNGVCLARALAGDRTQESLTKAWLENASFVDLLSGEVKPYEPAAIKAYPHMKKIYPGIDSLLAKPVPPGAKGVKGLRLYAQLIALGWILRKSVQELISNQPHSLLDGSRMSTLIQGALGGMDKRPGGLGSLLPPGHPLDLFVTATDFAGAPTRVAIESHSVPDQRYRGLFHFTANQADGDYGLDGEAHLPILGFATRATSSFPSAFPPVSLAEFAPGATDLALIDHFFRPYVLEEAGDVTNVIDRTRRRLFFDGGILDNWPFDHALDAIRGRLADCEVDRRLLYLEPDPMGPPTPDAGVDPPHILATLQRGGSDIPLSQSLGEALLALRDRNAMTQRLADLVSGEEGAVTAAIAGAAPALLAGGADAVPADVWNDATADLHRKAAADTGYLRLKLTRVVDGIADRMCTLLRYPPEGTQAWIVREVMLAWAKDERLLGVAFGGAPSADQVAFLQAFDLGYMQRRLTFTRDGVSRLYGMPGAPPRAALDTLKTLLSSRIASVQSIGAAALADPAVAQKVEAILGRDALAPVANADDLVAATAGHAAASSPNVSELRQMLQDLLSTRVDRLGHETFNELQRLTAGWEQAQRNGILGRYLGFPIWDSLTYAITVVYGVGERDAVDVVRISPREAVLGKAYAPDPHDRLMGTKAHHFGAFYHRSFRENDYLWGRLDGAEQLVHMMAHSVSDPGQRDVLVRKHCRNALIAILDEEAVRLSQVGTLVDQLRPLVDETYPQAGG
ncbi:MAG: patatin-like protein [Mycobacteriales bacterium]